MSSHTSTPVDHWLDITLSEFVEWAVVLGEMVRESKSKK
jgi:hypothetical protein